MTSPETCPVPAVHGGTKTINLALQGGGAHGAFTWGALDRLLEEERVEIEAISGTSAGAMNAAAFKSGYADGDRKGAGQALAHLWGSIGEMARRSSFNPVLEWVKAIHPTLTTVSAAIDAAPQNLMNAQVAQFFSPYDLNPFDINPLRDLLADDLDFDRVCAACRPHLYIAATNVRTGKIRVFEGEEISVDAIVASTCLPSLFQAVEIDDPTTGRKEAFWDGGFTGNPALFPLHRGSQARDVVIVHINPMERDEVPRTAKEIENRVNEISFNSSLNFELRAINMVRRLIREGKLHEGEWKDVLIHSVADDETMRRLGASTKVNPDPFLLEKLREAGAAAMDRFLSAHWDDLGTRATVDLEKMYG
ncbi:patatin-like phospholipase family protein [Rhodovulum sp. DZ06]|uniref:patatin-like phospholipase family protein n=1 Tax=Rhodovulum sp. DZ06 TaxID=3425126 RepID=UPI003D34333F